ncbi:MAG: hypothetical protein AAB834_04795 [Patescibacteria group bacterium]
MAFRRGEQVTPIFQEPQPLGVGIDAANAALWDEYMDQVNPSLDGLYQLWQDPEITNPGIRQRAVAAMTAPREQELPYAHPDQSIGRLLNITDDVRGESTSSLRARLADRPELAQEVALGVLFWLNALKDRPSPAKGSADPRYDYQEAIQELLPLATKEVADELFAHFSINDIEPYYNMDTASGYRPAGKLLSDPDMPRRYKGACLAAWFKVARAELTGTELPREEWEGAAKHLAEFIASWTYGKNVDDEMHTRIVGFLDANLPKDQRYVQEFAVGRVADHINHDNLRFWFTWRHIAPYPVGEGEGFRINDDSDLALVEWMRQEAARRELPFEERANTLVADYQERQTEVSATQLARAALLARLRAPYGKPNNA